MRITLAVLNVLSHFTDDVTTPHYGYDLMKATGYPSGKLYPILARLTAAGVLTRGPEATPPNGGPQRYTYTLSRDGAVWARQALAENSVQLTPLRIRLRVRSVGGQA